MFGGNLITTAVVAIEQCDLLVVAFSHQLYLFSLSEATIKDKLTPHQHPILHLYYSSRSSTLYSVDQHGLLCSFRVGKHAVLEQLEKQRITKKILKEARVRQSKEAEVEVLALSVDGTLIRHVGQCEYLIEKEVSRILLLNDDYLVLAKQNSNTLHIFSAVNLQKLHQYESQSRITSAEQDQKNLIIGNQQGKIIILVGFLSEGVIQLQQKLQWHVHEVSSLKIDGSYLYSAGQEGVVVVWHLRENRRDFLPRIGSGVVSLQIIGSRIYCFLADNSLKSIDLANDKALLHYKTIINPHAQLISQSSQELVTSNLIRVSSKADRLFLRASPGRIQEIDLHSGINIEHSIISRNYVSRLDAHLPSPHQLTDICLSKDNAHLAVAVQGIGCRSLRFYDFEGGELKLVSKVENCHQGQSNISLASLSDNRFLSFTSEDSSVKVWKLSTRRKESMLEIDEHFWCCDYEINFRQQLPRFVSINGNKIVITYSQEFIAFNTTNKNIEGVYRLEQEQQGREVIGVVPHHNKFLIFFDNAVELAATFNNSIGQCQRLLSFTSSIITSHSIVLNHSHSNFALLLQQEASTDVYYFTGGDIAHIQAPATQSLRLNEVFWLRERLIGLDSSMFFYDLTHERELVELQRKQSISGTEAEEMEVEGESQGTSYEQLYRKYLDRQFKKDRVTVQRNNQVLSVSPSVSSCFQMLAPQLFL